MALPVPHDMYMTQPVMYTMGQPPFVPSVNVSPDVGSYLPFITTAVMNEISSKAGLNPSRVFVFNLFSSQGWNNVYFKDVVELAAGLIALTVRKQQFRDISTAIVPCAENAVTLMTSKYVFEFPELKAYCQPNIVNVAMQNYGVLNSLKQEIASMSQYPQTMMQPGYPQYPQPQMQPGYQQPMMAPMMPQYPQQGYQQPMMAQYPQPMIQPMPTNSFGVPAGQAAVVPMGGRTVDTNRYGAPANTTQQPQTVSQPTPVVKENTMNITPLQEAETMDRSQHMLYFAGNSYPLDRLKRDRSSTRQAEELAMVKDPDTPSIYLNHTAITTTGLDSVIFESRFVQRQHQHAGDDVEVFRSMAINVTPFICHESHREIIESIIAGKTIAEIATLYKSVSMSLTSIDAPNKLELVDVLECLDKDITLVINRFLQTELNTDVAIDSMSGDGPDLYEHIKTHFPEQTLMEFKEFESTLGETYKFMDLEDEKSLRDILVDDSGLEVTLLSSSVTITLIDLYDRELGIKLGKGAYVIDSNRHKLLYQLAKSLLTSKMTKGWSSNTDYLVTRDNVRYTLHQSVIQSDQYLIRKA